MEEKIQSLVSGSMAMGETGMYERAEYVKHMDDPSNTLSTMGGMFTLLKVHKDEKIPGTTSSYVCPMHPEVRQSQPGKCPKCGMTLEPESEPAHGH